MLQYLSKRGGSNMDRYDITCNKKRDHESEHISGKTLIRVTDRKTGEIQEFSKTILTNGFPLNYNQELCDTLFNLDDLFYKWFPIEFRADKMTNKLIKKYYIKLYEYYLIKFRDKTMSHKYARHKGSSLYYVPEEQVTQEMCDAFICANPDRLQEVPREYMKEEYIDILIKRRTHLGMVPLDYRTIEVCMKFVQDCKWNIQYVPDELLPDVCKLLGIQYNSSLNLDKENHFMKNRIQDRNGLIYIQRN